MATMKNILLVDDENDVLDIGTQLLRSLGFEVVPCLSPQQALALFEKDPERYDLVITDMSMPQMTGDIFLQEIIRIRPDCPVIICTGYNTCDGEMEADEFGRWMCIQKPVTRKTLDQAIRILLNQVA